MKSKFTKFLVIWFFILLGAGIWVFARNSFSKENLELEILGPETISAGSQVDYTIKYRNKGDIRLEEAKLVFELPENSLVEEGGSLRVSKELEDIYPGQEIFFTFSCRVFGKEGEIKTARATVSYKPKNLKSIYESQTSYTTKISKVPLTFDFDLPSQMEPGRASSFSLNYFSNSDLPLFDLGVKVFYPEGFQFSSSKPAALEGNEWRIGLLNRADGGRVEISGILSGEIGQQKAFRAQIGVWQNDNFVVLKEVSKGVDVMKPSLYLFSQINGSSEYVASPGELLHYEIFFRNIGDEPFEDLFLIASLDSQLFDFNSVKSLTGKYNKSDNTLLWDWRNIPSLKFLAQGEEGKVDFWVDIKGVDSLADISGLNPSLKVTARISEAREEFATKMKSSIILSQKGFFEDEVFGNTGSVPPEVGKKTTYTVIWQVKNLYNDVRNVKVKARLPENVRPTGEIFPEDKESKFAFDSASREIVWDVGDLKAKEGFITDAPNISFQLELIPLREQAGQVATIIEDARVQGEDTFTKEKVEGSAEMVDTSLPDDKTMTEEQGIVKAQEEQP